MALASPKLRVTAVPPCNAENTEHKSFIWFIKCFYLQFQSTDFRMLIFLVFIILRECFVVGRFHCRVIFVGFLPRLFSFDQWLVPFRNRQCLRIRRYFDRMYDKVLNVIK
jgi:hypothetical protein